MRKILFTLTMSVALFVSCEKSNNDQEIIDDPTPTPTPEKTYDELYPRRSVQLSELQKQMNNTCNQFAWDFMYQINQQQVGKNCFVSPLSMSIALAMLQNGAAGNTLDQIKSAIGFSNYSLSEVNDYYKTLTSGLYDADKGIEFNLANAIWNNELFPAKDQYISSLKTVFNAQFSLADFDDTKLPSVINDWCSKQTNGRIDNMVKTISEQSILLLFNAVYFKAQWSKKFDKDYTESNKFTTMLDGVVKSEFMNDQREICYFETPNYQYAEIEMGNGAYNTFFVLPAEGKSVAEVAQLLKTEWDSVVCNKTTTDVICRIPKYEVKFATQDAIKALQALGIVDAFIGGVADFSPMFEGDVWVSNIQQKSFFAINEESVEAAAVTQISVDCTSVGEPSLPKELNLNRPFIYGIRESSSGTILFNGCMYNPQEKNN